MFTLEELYNLRPDRMRIVPSQSMIPMYYEYVVNGQVSAKYDVNTSTGESDVKQIKLSNPLDLADNHKIRLGTGNDLQLFHNGSNSFIDDAGTGSLFVESGGTVGFSGLVETTGVSSSAPSLSTSANLYSKPALSIIVSNGDDKAFNNTLPASLVEIFWDAFSNAIPPPGTIPSCNAAFVAYIASSTLSFFSLSSTLEFAPTLIMPTLPDNLASPVS